MTWRRRALSLGKRLAVFFLSLLLLSAAVFYISRWAPGDPLVSYYGDRAERMGPAEREWAMEKLGLKDPIHVQYVRWLEGALRGEFGISFKYKQDVLEVVGGRLGSTLLLGGLGFALTFALALGLALFCVWFEGRWPDRLLCRLGTVSSCIPEFWLSLVLILLLAVTWRILPSSGAYTAGGGGGLADRARHLVLPLAVVVLSHLWYYAYMLRNRLLEEVRADYVLLEKAAGLPRRDILLGHCLRNCLPAYLSLMAISVPHILGGAYVVETVFSYPGIGTLAYESARYRDYNLLMVLCILSGALVMLAGLLGQALGEGIDPRLRAEGKGEEAEPL